MIEKIVRKEVELQEGVNILSAFFFCPNKIDCYRE